MVYKCPKCGQTQSFETQATINVRLDKVEEKYLSTLIPMTDRYRMDNEMMCLDCRWQGRMANFHIDENGV